MPKKTAEYERYIVNITQNAENDLNEIIMFIANNNPQNAVKIMERIQAKISTLNRFPNKGPYVPELLKRNIKQYRQIIEHPWKIIYRVDDRIVNILAIIDSRRNLQDILIKKLLK
ncbi:MAG: type II toxin-antitoxin system RelE/ParE family toxin [Leptospirales bacterium]|nr:type II toxin-antitoxin system RelE/ParE family toxin [Leptospirales bacterium]